MAIKITDVHHLEIKRSYNSTNDYYTTARNLISLIQRDDKYQLKDGEPMIVSYLDNSVRKYFLAIGRHTDNESWPVITPMFKDPSEINDVYDEFFKLYFAKRFPTLETYNKKVTDENKVTVLSGFTLILDADTGEIKVAGKNSEILDATQVSHGLDATAFPDTENIPISQKEFNAYILEKLVLVEQDIDWEELSSLS